MSSRTRWTFVAPLLTAAALLAVPPATAADWNRFRGPGGSGVAEGAPAPLEFGPQEALVWRTPLPPGKSSPVVAGKSVFLTAHEGEKLLTIALDRRSGQTLWTQALMRSRVDGRHDLNDPAVPTPVTDGESLYVFFADFGLVAYSVSGQELWRLAARSVFESARDGFFADAQRRGAHASVGAKGRRRDSRNRRLQRQRSSGSFRARPLPAGPTRHQSPTRPPPGKRRPW